MEDDSLFLSIKEQQKKYFYYIMFPQKAITILLHGIMLCIIIAMVASSYVEQAEFDTFPFPFLVMFHFTFFNFILSFPLIRVKYMIRRGFQHYLKFCKMNGFHTENIQILITYAIFSNVKFVNNMTLIDVLQPFINIVYV